MGWWTKFGIKLVPALLVGAICFLLGMKAYSGLFNPLSNALGTKVQQKVSVQMLRNEELLLLVTNRIVSQVVVEHNEYSTLLGTNEGYLVATVKLYYGIDLEKLSPDAIRDEGNVVVVTVPKPALLDFSVDPEMTFISKRSGLNAMKDWLLNHDLEKNLRKQIKDQAISFLEKNDQIPNPDAALARLNRFAPLLGGRVEREIVFRYAE